MPVPHNLMCDDVRRFAPSAVALCHGPGHQAMSAVRGA
ncbi:hypothetical protein SCOCK_850004 [Actinacidiphila cocklensis]|uniref:Uncharacterized protein n=1 Tax=Actinacidiphila cocklensis TaxID=887465 RepID=A0A9W4E1F6_9ACTN|nr:hypothetical protein SCOCK_850004 [Actinacidiphila cocklensis]